MLYKFNNNCYGLLTAAPSIASAQRVCGVEDHRRKVENDIPHVLCGYMHCPHRQCYLEIRVPFFLLSLASSPSCVAPPPSSPPGRASARVPAARCWKPLLPGDGGASPETLHGVLCGSPGRRGFWRWRGSGMEGAAPEPRERQSQEREEGGREKEARISKHVER